MIGFKSPGKGSTKYSNSKWEVSYYGGYYGLIVDHPDVVLSYKMDIETKKNMGLSWYISNKLMKIFLLKVKERGLIPSLTSNMDIVTKEAFFMKKEVLMVNKASLLKTFESVVGADSEHANLFLHYKEIILNAELSLPISNSSSGFSGSSSKKDKNEKKQQSKTGEKEKQNNDQKKNSSSGQDKKEEENQEQNISGSKSKTQQDKNKEKELQDKNQGNAGSNPSDIEDEDEFEDSIDNGEDHGEISKYGGELTDDDIHVNTIREIKAEFERMIGDIAKREMITHYLNGDMVKSTKFEQLSDLTKCAFSEEECRDASRLSRMLDISFDPAVDRVNSLRTGKLDARKVAEVLPGNTNVYYLEQEEQTTKPFTIVILADESGSMSDYNKINKSKSLLKILYLAFSDILPQEKIYIYGHSGYGSPRILVYQDKYNQKFEERINHMQSRDYNYDGPAIEAIYNKIRGITSDNIIFITLSDGAPCGADAIPSMKKILEKCRRDGFVTVGLGILHFNSPELYNYSAVINNLGEDMVKKTSHIINKVVKTEFQ